MSVAYKCAFEDCTFCAKGTESYDVFCMMTLCLHREFPAEVCAFVPRFLFKQRPALWHAEFCTVCVLREDAKSVLASLETKRVLYGRTKRALYGTNRKSSDSSDSSDYETDGDPNDSDYEDEGSSESED